MKTCDARLSRTVILYAANGKELLYVMLWSAIDKISLTNGLLQVQQSLINYVKNYRDTENLAEYCNVVSQKILNANLFS